MVKINSFAKNVLIWVATTAIYYQALVVFAKGLSGENIALFALFLGYMTSEKLAKYLGVG